MSIKNQMNNAIITQEQAYHFAGRENDLQDLEVALANTRKKGQRSALYNLHAITGMGKTWLVYEFLRRLQQRGDTVCAWLSFEPSTTPDDSFSKRAMGAVSTGLRACWEAFPINGLDQEQRSILEDPAYNDIPVGWETYQPPPTAPEALHDRPYVFIIDALNSLDRHDASEQTTQLWDDLQKQVITPLVEQADVRVFVVCVSQVPLHWSFWELRESCISKLLYPFELEDTKDFLRKYQLEDNALTIQKITQGHPASIHYIVTRYLSQRNPKYEEAKRLLNSEPDRLNEQYIEIKEQIASLDGFAQSLLNIIGVLRRVEVPTIRHLLKQLNWTQSSSLPSIHKALSDYVEHGLLGSSPGHLPFSFTDHVRRVIESDLSQAEQIEIFIKICEILQQWYLGILQQRPVTNRHYLGEWVYFSLLYMRLVLDSPSNKHMQEIWLDQLKEYIDLIHNEHIIKKIYDDIMIQDLLAQVGLQHEANRILASLDREIEGVVYQREIARQLIYYLFHERFPRALTKDNQKLLRFIARSLDEEGRFIGESPDKKGFTAPIIVRSLDEEEGSIGKKSGKKGFTAPKLMSAIKIAIEEKRLDLPIDLSPVQLRAHINLFNEIYAIVYDNKHQAYVMDPWLQRFLQSATAIEEQDE